VGDFIQKAWDLSFFVSVFLNIIWGQKSIIFGAKYVNNLPTLELLNKKPNLFWNTAGFLKSF